jgi:hypothetical protein
MRGTDCVGNGVKSGHETSDMISTDSSEMKWWALGIVKKKRSKPFKAAEHSEERERSK